MNCKQRATSLAVPASLGGLRRSLAGPERRKPASLDGLGRSLAGALAFGLLIGCGFHLRTWNLADAFERVRIEADDSVDFQRELVEALESTGVQVVDAHADLVLQLARQQRERRNVAATRTARASEFELSLQVQFTVMASDGDELAATQVLRSERSVPLQSNLLGSSAEQALVVEELRSDIVGQMLRTIAALARATASNESNQAAAG